MFINVIALILTT